jgi:hypothetical protein
MDVRERAEISYFFQLLPNSCLCERRRKTTSTMKLFWKIVWQSSQQLMKLL